MNTSEISSLPRLSIPTEICGENAIYNFIFSGKTGWTGVIESEYKKRHDIFDGAPDEWAAERGATHTLYLGKGLGRGTRPARLLATVLYVGCDEDAEGNIVWAKWKVRHYGRRPLGQ